MKCPSKIGLKVATDPVSRVSRTPAWYRHTEGTEAVAAETEQFRWRREFCEAVDQVHSELEKRFDRDSIRIVARRETMVIDAAKGHAVELELQLLHLPKQLDAGRLQLQRRVLGDISKESQCHTFPEVASCLTKLHPQTRGLFREVKNLCLSHQRDVSPPFCA